MLELTSAGYMIALVSAGLTLVSSLVRHVVLDKEKLKGHKEKVKHHREQIKEAQKRKDVKAMQKHQQEMLNVSMEQMHQGFKPMLFTLIPFILVFQWMSGAYGTLGYAYNVTVTDQLPGGVTFNSIDLSPNGNQIGDTLVWNWSIIEPGVSGELNVTLTSEGQMTEFIPTPLALEYYLHNGSFVRTEASEDAVLKLSKTQVQVNGNKARYSILYGSVGSTTVATIFGMEHGWFWWYFACSFITGMIFNKILGTT
ncbi:MAG: EMC3/TMCO1 family protein [Candidatus Altiarchaeota archaeon]